MDERNKRQLPSLFGRGVQFIADVALLLHIAGAAGWWWLSPKGFSAETSQFWTNAVLPWATMAVAITGLVATHRGHRTLAANVVLCFAATWAAAALAARWTFPLSFAGIWWLLATVALCGCLLSALVARNEKRSHAASVCSIAIGALVGTGIVRGQIPEPPSTIPWQTELQLAKGESEPSLTSANEAPRPDFHFFVNEQALALRSGDLHITCKPILTFHRVSLDHCWSLLARRTWTLRRQFVREGHDGEARAYFYDDGARIEISRSTDDDYFDLSAFTPVSAATYSHLNTFCELEISGHDSLAIAFSPAAGSIIDVLPADYPFGRPARFAYLSETGVFRVCEAASGEKGPFRELAAAPLKRGEPLTIVLYDNRRPVISITLDDWTSQLSTAISPAAGWGVPVNEIQFQRLGDAPSSRVGIWISLAATAVGRGFETVGHSTGIYRNRMTLQLHPSEP